MAKKVIFAGDELELLSALDRTGCVLTDDGKFYCNLENDKLPFNSRLPVRIRGTYASDEKGWRIAYSIVPAPRTLSIGVICLFALIAFAASGASLTGVVLFAIICAALIINFAAQKNDCLRRFENMLLRGIEI